MSAGVAPGLTIVHSVGIRVSLHAHAFVTSYSGEILFTPLCNNIPPIANNPIVTMTGSLSEETLKMLMLRSLDGDEGAYRHLLHALRRLLTAYFDRRMRTASRGMWKISFRKPCCRFTPNARPMIEQGRLPPGSFR